MQDLLRMELSGSRFAQNGSTGHGDGKNLLEGVEAFHFNPDGTVRNQIRSRDADKPDGAEAKRHERVKFVVIGRHCRGAKTPRQCQTKCVCEGYGMTRLEDCRILPEGGVGVIAAITPASRRSWRAHSAAVTPPRR